MLIQAIKENMGYNPHYKGDKVDYNNYQLDEDTLSGKEIDIITTNVWDSKRETSGVITDCLRAYMDDISSYKKLTEKEYLDLFDKYHNGDMKAREKLINCNLALVVTIAKRYDYKGSPIDIMDLIQEGSIGLVKAVEKYDPSTKLKFSTYAVCWIERYIIPYIKINAHTIRMPLYARDEEIAVEKFSARYKEKYGISPSVETIMKEMDIPLDRAITYMYGAVKCNSLDKVLFNDEDGKETTLADMVADSTQNPEEELIKNELARDIRKAIKCLNNEKWEKIIIHRFGLIDGVAKTCEELAKEMGVSRQNVNAMEKKALEKLRKNEEVIKLLSSYVKG